MVSHKRIESGQGTDEDIMSCPSAKAHVFAIVVHTKTDNGGGRADLTIVDLLTEV